MLITSIAKYLFLLALLYPHTVLAITSEPDPAESASLYEQALMKFHSGEIDISVIHLKNALQADPSFLAGHVLLGRSYLEQGYASLAIKEFKSALTLGADKSLLVEHLARAYQLQRNFKQLLAEIYPGNYGKRLNAFILVARGEAYFQLGRLGKARLEFADAEKVDPGNVDALLGIATVLLRQARFKESDELINRVIALSPENPAVWYTKGALYHALSKFEESRKFYSKALEFSPGHYQAKLARAGVLMDDGNYQQAEKDLYLLYKKSPEDPQVAYLLATTLRQNGSRKKASEIMKEAKQHLEILPPEIINDHGPTLFLAGLISYDLQEYQKAKSYLTSYVTRFPQEVRPRIVLATIYLQEQALTKASKLLEPALDVASNDIQVLLLLGDIYMRKREYFKASEMLERAARVLPENVGLMTSRGLNDIIRGLHDKGYPKLKEALKRDPQAGAAGFILVTSLLKEERFQEALEVARLLRGKSPDNPLVLNLVATTQVEAGMLSAARNTYLRTLQLVPDFYPGQVNLAKLELVERNLDKAEEQFLTLLEQWPDRLHLMVELARVNVLRGSLDKAIRWLEKAYRTDRQFFGAGVRLVDLYLRTGKNLEALRIAQEMKSNGGRDTQGSDIQVLTALGRAQLSTGDALSASITFKKASEQASFQSLSSLSEIAELQSIAGDLDGAIYSVEKFIAAYPGKDAALIQLIGLQLKRGRLDRAAVGISQLEKGGSTGVTERLKGDLKVAEGDLQAALQHYLLVLEASPVSSVAARVSQVYLMLGKKDEALVFVEGWVERFPDDDMLREILAQGYLSLGRLDDARVQFESLVERGRAGALVYNNLAIIYNTQKDLRAEDFARKAYGLDPDRASILDTLGWVLVKKGDSEAGLRLLRNAFARASTNPEIRYHIAVALKQLGRYEEARLELEAAVKEGVGFSELENARFLLKELEQLGVQKQ
ncbi:XrtA/PEP-CTERM system TPR-repeat protein PrsT [Motiliproteus sp. MSK22-1]|uniref:XrtA/PEP-CTERM system TPR-repeat protein PrsT n=1 Tax=Motiliproteus sp. MSK22-1 TaxID=1897630 RepID=UPI000976256F|nr:XrtA/PEP-CTERM system TPR-repeat protein PrsT [Motiliproteus sp. MSK22-1]OMH25692.1 hypothetical protein BGP75_24445 [Motiliproteus sp. MSK22-1]